MVDKLDLFIPLDRDKDDVIMRAEFEQLREATQMLQQAKSQGQNNG